MSEKTINIDREPKILLDLSKIEAKRGLIQHINMLKPGLYEVSIKERKFCRSTQANSYYWIAVCTPFALWLTEQSGERFTKEDAHEYLKKRFCQVKAREIINEETGEMIEIGHKQSTAKLDTGEFSEYVKACSDWMADFCGLVVLSGDEFYGKAA
jgi:hypothetical protein